MNATAIGLHSEAAALATLPMPVFRYYVSAQVTDRSPPLAEMATITADSPVAAAQQVVRERLVSLGPGAVWIHFVSDLDESGRPCGFRSIPLGTIKPSDAAGLSP